MEAKPKSLSLIFLCFGWLFAISPAAMSGEPVQIFLLAGQSNMDGSALANRLPTTPFNFQEPQEDVLFYFGDPRGKNPPDSAVPSETLIPLQPGSSSQVGSVLRFGPEITFGRAIADAWPAEKIALIKYGQLSSSLALHWNPAIPATFSAFQQTVANGLDALEAQGHAAEIAGMLWLQGESDVKDQEFRDGYEANLTNFIAAVRSDFGSDLPFVIGQLSIGQTGGNRTVEDLEVIRTAQANVASNVFGVGLVVTDGILLSTDDLHFGMEGQMALGYAFAEQYLGLVVVPEPASLPALLVGILVFIAMGRSRSQVAHVGWSD